MAKESMKAREVKRAKIVAKYADKRKALKEAGDYEALQKLPKNASPIRKHNRCKLTGRPKGYMRQFGISRVTFREIEPEYTVITGRIRSTENGAKIENALISVIDEETGDIYGDYIPNLETMRYVIILPPGKFEIFVESDGYEEIYQNIEVLDKSSFQSHIELDFSVEQSK